ncbi:uncharacterized protein [Euwallacea fornicatus]|uniref:uncharacterized protein n=1 Tax=Euwallacea fornicatus TaxID=995702 RepID=UPI00338D85E0
MMCRILWILTFACLLGTSLCLSCLEVKKRHEKSCLESDSANYIHCVRARMKRNQDNCQYDSNCYECDCEGCSYSLCGGPCDSCCNSCCNNYVQCHHSHCCHKQCNSECRSSECRINCRHSCYKAVKQEKEIVYVPVPGPTINTGGGDSNQHSTSVNNNNSPNITTIINIKSIVNNTQHMDIPINMTYTNRNNITLLEESNCCVVIGPRQCVNDQTNGNGRCYHTRSKQCGDYCTSNIVHQENRQVCNSVDGYGNPTNCQQQTTYIPQPQPKCIYTSSWPYVSCGIQPSADCHGCYGHYFNPNIQNYKTCSPQCYDNFNVGPLYRQGPFYQSPYLHPCMQSSQGCWGGFGGGMFGPGMGGFGFGNGFGYGGISAPFPIASQSIASQNWPQINATSYAVGNFSSFYNQGAIAPSWSAGVNEIPVTNPEYQNDMPFVTLVGGEREIEIDVAVKDPKSSKDTKPLTKEKV